MSPDRSSRGFAEPVDEAAWAAASTPALQEALRDASPVTRTVAVRLLARRLPVDAHPAFVDALLALLAREKALYTRLEIAAALEEGGTPTAQRMLPWLGRIGANQHDRPARPSRKRTYPLPRDLVARMLGHMRPEVFPLLLEAVAHGKNPAAAEAIDAAGFMAYHQPQLATDNAYSAVIQTLYLHMHDAVIVSKCLTCLSAFPTHACAEFLQAFLALFPDGPLRAQALRSLDFVGAGL